MTIHNLSYIPRLKAGLLQYAQRVWNAVCSPSANWMEWQIYLQLGVGFGACSD